MEIEQNKKKPGSKINQSSIRHEVNNQISTITSITYLLERLIKQEPPDLEKMKIQIQKINQVAFQLSDTLTQCSLVKKSETKNHIV